jgi:hypothetical protein
MRFKLFEAINRLWTRLSWPSIAVMLLLQRSPIPRIVADLQFSVVPRMVHIFKWILGATVTSSLYQSVTGATGDLTAIGNIKVVEGSTMIVAVQAYRAVPVTAKIVGDLPPGLNHDLGEDGTLSKFGVITISGIATTAGEYPITVTVLTWETIQEPAEQPERSISIAFEITLEGPDVTKDPESIVVAVGTTAELSVEVANAEGTTFQWQRNVGASLDDFANIQGATDSVYSVPNVMADSQGAYQVRVSKNGQTITTPFAFLTVRAANFGTWQIREFGTATSDESQPLENPDKDSFPNAFEFLFDLDPESPDSIQSPVVSYETIGAIDYVVFSFPALIDYPNLNFNFESTNDLADDNPWTKLVDGIDGTIIDLTSESTVLKVPTSDQLYCRIRIDTGG